MTDISSMGSSMQHNNLETEIIDFEKRQEQAILKAKMLLASGQDIAFVANATGLSLTAVMRLQREQSL